MTDVFVGHSWSSEDIAAFREMDAQQCADLIAELDARFGLYELAALVMAGVSLNANLKHIDCVREVLAQTRKGGW